MPIPTVISKVLAPNGSTLYVAFSTPMATGANGFAMEGYTLSNGVISGNVITWSVSPRVASTATLSGVLYPNGSVTSTTGEALFAWPSDTSPAGDVTNLSVYGGPSALASYLTVGEADSIADSLYGLTAWANASDADKLKALATASARVDASRRWQGRKYGLDADGETIEQELEFPRVDGATPIAANPNAPTSLVPIVPPKIEQAVVWEADSLLSGSRKDRVAAQHDGLVSQDIGSASETYRPATNGQGVPILCPEADMLCRRYQLRSGALL